MNIRRVAGFSLLSLIWGSSWMAATELEGHCPPLRAAAIRYGAAAVVLLIVAAARRNPIPRGRPLRAMLALGATMVGLPAVLLQIGARAVPAGTTAVLYSLAPAALVLLSSAGRGAPAPRQAFYASLAGFGAMTLAMSGAFGFSFSHPVELAAIAIAIVSVTWSLAFAKDELQESSVVTAAAVQLAVAAVLMLIVSAVGEHSQPSHWDRPSVISLALLSLVGSAIALPLFYWLLQQGEPSHVATLEWMQPLISIGEGAILLRQTPPPTFYIGSAAILACVALLFQRVDQPGASVALDALNEKNEP
jgi:drug/metabolite transporter (DMT)-like permease